MDDDSERVACVLCGEEDVILNLTKPKDSASWTRLKEAAALFKNDKLVSIDNLASDSKPRLYHLRCRERLTNKKNQRKVETQNKNEVGTSNISIRPKKRRTERTSTVLTKACVYCNKHKYKKGMRTRENLSAVMTLEIDQTIKNAARKHVRMCTENSANASRILAICTKDLVSSEAFYHRSCHQDFIRILKGSECSTKRTRNEYKAVELVAFNAVLDFCQKLIQEPKVVHLNTLKSIMEEEFEANGVEWSSNDRHNFPRKLRARVIELRFLHASLKTVLVYPITLKIETVVLENYKLVEELEKCSKMEHNMKVCLEAGTIIRKRIKQIDTRMSWPPAEEDLKVQNVPKYIPEELNTFMTALFPSDCARSARYQMSLSQDLVYTASGGSVRTPKSVLLPAVIKGLTNNTQSLRLLNKLGHGVSYDILEELDTLEALRSIDAQSESGVVIPKTFFNVGNLNQIALMVSDNIDNLERTLSGSGTSHRVNSILVMDTKPDDETVLGDGGPKNDEVKRCAPFSSKKIRSLPKCVLTEMPPFFMTNKKGPGVLRYLNHDVSENYETSAQRLKLRYMLWVATRHISSRTDLLTPGWTGFNILVRDNILILESKIGYLDTLNAPATEYATANEILRRAVYIKQKLNLSKIVAVFDQALYAKCAEILWQHTEEFDGVVLMMGGFHLLLVMLAILGIRFGDAGLKDVATLSGVIAEGSIDSVLAGRSYNRAVRLHKLTYEALIRLLIDGFHQSLSEEQEHVVQQFQSELDELKEDINSGSFAETLQSDGYKTWYLLFQSFVEEIKKTSGHLIEFWLSYLNLTELLMNLIYATRTGDWNLYLACLEETIPWIFAYDRQNYAKYMLPYLNDMKSLPEKHPDVHKAFLGGEFSVQMATSNGFSRNEADKTIENTINKDCKTSGGYIGFSSDFAATQRWVLNARQRAERRRCLQEMADYEPKTCRHVDLLPKRIERDETDVNNIANTFEATLTNPWEGGTLRSISTGLVAPADVAHDLLNAKDAGFKAYEQFVTDRCVENSPKEYFVTLTKLKLKTFSSLKKKIKTSAKGKTVALKCDASLFARMAIIAQHRNIDLRHVFTFPLGPIPWSLSNCHGLPRKTEKAQLLHTLEYKVPKETGYPHNAAFIYDGMHLLRKIKIANGVTFDFVAETVLSKLINSPSQCIHIVFDVYKDVSIKNFERYNRSQGTPEGASYTNIRGAFPVKSWAQFLSCQNNKVSIVAFLLESWKCDDYRRKLGDKVLFVAANNDCWRIAADGVTLEAELCCDHEEADTRMVLHAAYIGQYMHAVVVHADDTDVFLLLLAHLHEISCKVYMRMGRQHKDRLIALNNVVERHGQELPESIEVKDFFAALLGFHSFTGCDSVSAFLGKGKKSPMKILKKSEKFIRAFKTLGESWQVTDTLYDLLEEFVCEMYGKTLSDVNALRYHMYCTRRGTVDPELLPPCHSTLRLHIDRSNYQTAIWRRSILSTQSIPLPFDHGWCMEDGSIAIRWLATKPAPEEVLELVSCKCKHCSTAKCQCKNLKLRCTDLCSCEDQCKEVEEDALLPPLEENYWSGDSDTDF